MKKRKILYLFPLAALVLSGCTFQEGWEITKNWTNEKVFTPVVDFFKGLLGIEDKKEEKKEDEKPTPGPEGGGEGEGEGGGEVSKYGDEAHPLSVSAANALIATENPTLEDVFVVGEVLTNEAWNSEYGQVTITLTDGVENIKVFRCGEFREGFDKEGIKINSMKGQTVVAKGIGEIYNNTYELTTPAVLSVTGEGPQHHDVDNYGTAQNPLTVSEAIAVIDLQDPTDQDLYVAGKVKSHGNWSDKYSNVDLIITDGEKDLTLFRCGTFPQGIDPTSVKDNAYKDYLVVAKGQGMYYVDGKKYELNQGCEVLSLEEEVIPVTGVEVSPTSMELEVGQQAAITASVLPAEAKQEVEWAVVSSDQTAEVAEYRDGKVIAKAAGTATVTATSVSDPTKSASCTVTVTEATKELLSIAFSGEVEKTAYNEEEAYSAAGLKVMAHYDKGDDVDVTADATIELSKQVAAVGDTSFKVTASFGTAQSIEKDVAVTVAEINQIAEAYAAAVALENKTESTEEYVVRGVVTAKRGTEFFIQSGDYGFDIYNPGNNDFAIGKMVRVKSTVKNYNRTYETGTISSATVTGDGQVPSPVIITSATDQEAARLNLLAQVEGVATADVTVGTSDLSVVIKVGNDDLTVYVKKNQLGAQGLANLGTVKAGDTLTFTNLITGAYKENLQLLACDNTNLTIEAAPAKEIASITSVTGPSEVALNGTVSADDVTVVVEYTDGSSGNATVTAVTVDTTSAGEKTADVTIEGWNETLHFTITVTSSAPQEQLATFTLGSDGDKSHADGSAATAYTETNNGKTLSLSNGVKMFKDARDAQGNGCLKFGTSSAGGSFDIDLSNVTGIKKVRIYAAQYKSRTDGTIAIAGGSAVTLTGTSDTGTYDEFEITITNQTSISVVFAKRAMMNSIVFVF